jgi:hypothetical protein
MARRDPHFRVYEALDIVEDPRKKPSDKKVEELVKVITRQSKDEVLEYAWDKFQNSRSRICLNAFVIAEASPDTIRRSTGVPIAVVQAYAAYICDITVFRDRLDRLSYIDSVSQYGDQDEALYLRAAVTAGAPYIVWLLGNQTDETPKEVVRAHMIDGYHRAKAHRNAPLDSIIAREARIWASESSKNAVALHRIDPQESQDALEQLRLKLVYDDGTISENTVGAPAPEDILHGSN